MPSARPALRRLRAPLQPRWIALAVAASLAACGGESDLPPTPLPADPMLPVPLGDSPVRGSATPTWATLVEFSDFECSFCAGAEPTLARVLTVYGSDVQLVYKHFPLSPSPHPHARAAAIAAECARVQGKFWEMHDELFAHRTALDDATLLSYATAVLPDAAAVTAWQACLSTPEPAARVDADMALLRQYSTPATPTFFLNGRMFLGAQPFDYFKAAIDVALSEAKASGIPQDQYYAKKVLKQ